MNGFGPPHNKPSIASLRRAIEISEKIASLESELRALLGSAGVSAAAPTPGRSKGSKKRRTMSPEARARIVAAQKARWAKFKNEKGGSAIESKAAPGAAKPGRKKRRKMSPEARARIVAAQKKRWAAFQKAK